MNIIKIGDREMSSLVGGRLVQKRPPGMGGGNIGQQLRIDIRRFVEELKALFYRGNRAASPGTTNGGYSGVAH